MAVGGKSSQASPKDHNKHSSYAGNFSRFLPGHFGTTARTEVRDSSVGFPEFVLGRALGIRCFRFIASNDFFFLVFVGLGRPRLPESMAQEGLTWGSVSGSISGSWLRCWFQVPPLCPQPRVLVWEHLHGPWKSYGTYWILQSGQNGQHQAFSMLDPVSKHVWISFFQA